MVRKRIRRTGAAITAACAFGAVSPGEVRALTVDYCGFSIPAWSWCSNGSNHTYDSNKAYYNGSASLSVCQRLIYFTSRVEYHRTCAPTSTYRYYWANTGTMFEAQVLHDNGSSRTIWGQGVA